MRVPWLYVMGGFLAGASWGCCPAKDSPPAATETELTEALSHAPEPQIKPDEAPPEAKRLLVIATDTKRVYSDRVEAVEKLGQYRGAVIVDRLLQMLPGDGGKLELHVIGTLGKIGDPRAIVPLQKMVNDERIRLPGKVWSAIDNSIEMCMRNRKEIAP